MCCSSTTSNSVLLVLVRGGLTTQGKKAEAIKAQVASCLATHTQSSKFEKLESTDCYACGIHGENLNGRATGATVLNYGTKRPSCGCKFDRIERTTTMAFFGCLVSVPHSLSHCDCICSLTLSCGNTVEDFVKYFDGVDVCFRGDGMADLALDVHEEMGLCGAFFGCVFGLLQYWVCCCGLYKLWCNRNSSAKINTAKRKRGRGTNFHLHEKGVTGGHGHHE